jgi:hypothetical protein
MGRIFAAKATVKGDGVTRSHGISVTLGGKICHLAGKSVTLSGESVTLRFRVAELFE